MNPRPLIAGGLFVLALALAGCGNSGDTAADPVSPSARATVAQSAPLKPVKPVMPAIARKHTQAGAMAFVRYFWALADYAQQTLDVAELDQLSLEGCRSCTVGLANLRRIAKRRGHFDGVRLSARPRSATITKTPHAFEAVVVARVVTDRGRLVYAGKRKDKRIKRYAHILRNELVWYRGSWQVSQFYIPSQ